MSPLARWDKLNGMSSPEAPEAVELLDAFAKINAAPPSPRIPTIVLSADKPWDPVLIEAHNNKVGGAMVTWDESLEAQNLLAASAPGKHVKNTNSGHYVYWYAPRLVADAIHEVVAKRPQWQPITRRLGNAGDSRSCASELVVFCTSSETMSIMTSPTTSLGYCREKSRAMSPP